MLRYVFLFFSYSMIGWAFESIVVSISQRTLVNRGFLFGPVCPIYGTSAVMMAVLLAPFAENIIVLFLLGMLICTAVEYITGWGMEKLFHMRWWDYSDKKLNLNGYICLSSSLVWGVLSIVLMKILHPLVFSLFDALSQVGSEALCLCIVLVFGFDLGVSLSNAVDMRAWASRYGEWQNELKEQLDQRLNLAGISERLHLPEGEKLRNFFKLRAFRAYPKMRVREYPHIMEEMREKLAAWLKNKSDKAS